MPVSGSIVCAAMGIVLGLGAFCSRAQGEENLALQVREIVESRCAYCHSGETAEGSINYILSGQRLIQRGMVVPRNATVSPFYRQVRTGAMPKDDDPLSADEIELIRQWINSGAQDWNPPIEREFISPVEIVTSIAQDLDTISRSKPRDLPFIRYFTLTHLWNAGYTEEELETYRVALSKMANSLSWGIRVVAPVPIDEQRTILRIDLRHYRWTRKTWEQIVEQHPYGVSYDSDRARGYYSQTQTSLPYVRGDWFVAKASVPPLYHDILGIPMNVQDLEKRLQIDVSRNLATDQAWRSGFNSSGVSNNNRLIERHVSDFTQGAYWKSYDFQPFRDPATGKTFPERNLFDHPLGPADVMPQVRRPFQHAGGEMIWNLPNGLQAYMLTDEHGQRIDKGPIDIVSDPNQPDRSVVNGLSCMSCHARGMKDKADTIRETVLSNTAAYSDKEVELVRALYPPAAVMQEMFEEDRKRFEAAVEATGGKLSDTDPVVVLARTFDSEVDLNLASAELGVRSHELVAALNSLPELARLLGSLKIPGGTVKRDVFVSHFGDAVQQMNLGTYLNVSRNVQPGELVNSIGMRFRLVPTGDCLIGSPEHEVSRHEDEGPQMTVEVSDTIHFGVHEVTQAQWRNIMGSQPSAFHTDGQYRVVVTGMDTRDFPVEFVSWFDAVEFCNKLSEREGLKPSYVLENVEREGGTIVAAKVTFIGGEGYRLPSESEWEYACRAETTTPFSFGSNCDASQANVNGTRPYGNAAAGQNFSRPTSVGSYSANDFGLFDMHGNVWEWCHGVYDSEIFLTGEAAPEDTQGAPGELRVVRGGSFNSFAADARSASRMGMPPFIRLPVLGFRVVRLP